MHAGRTEVFIMEPPSKSECHCVRVADMSRLCRPTLVLSTAWGFMSYLKCSRRGVYCGVTGYNFMKGPTLCFERFLRSCVIFSGTYQSRL